MIKELDQFSLVIEFDALADVVGCSAYYVLKAKDDNSMVRNGNLDIDLGTAKIKAIKTAILNAINSKEGIEL